MTQLLSHFTYSRDNNFNLLRFIAATLVLYSHSYALVIGSGEVEPPKSLIGMSWGNIAVDVFFITSGFLIAGSFYSRGNLYAYSWARLLRIIPGLFIAVIFCVFVVGLYYTTLSWSDFILHPDTWLYLIKNTLLLFGVEYRLPGVFEHNPYQYAVNGSLWTLPYELKMYIILAVLATGLIGLEKKYNKPIAKIFFATASILALLTHFLLKFEVIGFPGFLYRLFTPKFVQLFAMFFIGTTYYLWRDRIVLNTKVAIALTGILALSAISKDSFLVVYNLVLGYLVFYLAYVPAGKVRLFNKMGDYSYGIYIYAFPIQQAIIASFPGCSVAQMVVFSFLLTAIFAYASWHLIEKRSLAAKNKYKVLEAFFSKN